MMKTRLYKSDPMDTGFTFRGRRVLLEEGRISDVNRFKEWWKIISQKHFPEMLSTFETLSPPTLKVNDNENSP